MQLTRNDAIVTLTNYAQISNTDLDLSQIDGLAVQAVYSDATPVHKTFVAANVSPSANTITITAHGFPTGFKVALTGTNLPTGLSATNYWVIRVDANTIKLASSLANATAGTEVDITGAGTTADADLASTSTLSQVVKLQSSNDGVNYMDISGKTVTVTSAGNTMWDLGQVYAKILRVVVTPTTGTITLTVTIAGKQQS
jgi:hypothetical protein